MTVHRIVYKVCQGEEFLGLFFVGDKSQRLWCSRNCQSGGRWDEELRLLPLFYSYLMNNNGNYVPITSV